MVYKCDLCGYRDWPRKAIRTHIKEVHRPHRKQGSMGQGEASNVTVHMTNLGHPWEE